MVAKVALQRRAHPGEALVAEAEDPGDVGHGPDRSALFYDRIVARDKWGMRRSFRTPPGRSAVSWRWEVGLPLFLMGSVTAFLAASADLSGVLFWAGVVAAAVGASAFLAGLINR